MDETVFDAAAVRAATRSGPERFDGLIALLAGGHLATGEGPPPGGT